jgi:hypothetical protein
VLVPHGIYLIPVRNFDGRLGVFVLFPLRKRVDDIKTRVKPLPKDLDVWKLNLNDEYHVIDEPAEKILHQLGLPNLFAHEKEHEKVRMIYAFDNHPTHWLHLNFFKGGETADMNGLRFDAWPKASVSREKMLHNLKAIGESMNANRPLTFSQIPILKTSKTSNQTATKD